MDLLFFFQDRPMRLLLLMVLVVAEAAALGKMKYLETVRVSEEVAERIKTNPNTNAVSQDIINIINSNPSSPFVADSGRFENTPLSEVVKMCGYRQATNPAIVLPLRSPPSQQILDSLPDAFDSRDWWGKMCPSVFEVRDQAGCGACWAFGAVEAMTDRICIHSAGNFTPHLSAAEVMSCDNDSSYG